MATDISTSLPWLDLAAGSTITVDADDAGAVVTLLNVYGFPLGQAPPVDLLPPLLVHEPLATIGGAQ